MDASRLKATRAGRAAALIKRRLVTPAAPSAPTRAAPDTSDRLVPSPVFVYSCQRSGSTMLRMILDSHPEICAPHEMHLRTLRVGFSSWYGEAALKKFGIEKNHLNDLLWDRLFDVLLRRTGKSIIVDKTPANTMLWKRIRNAWPDARYIFLRRHPVHMAESLAAAAPAVPIAEHYETVTSHARAWAAARKALPGITISYEELTENPERVVRQVCGHLGVRFEARMLDYGRHEHTGDFRKGLGDWNDKIKSGVIQAAPPLPEADDIPAELREACELFGYS